MESGDRSRTRYTPSAPSLSRPIGTHPALIRVPRVIGSSSASGGSTSSALTLWTRDCRRAATVAALFLAGGTSSRTRDRRPGTTRRGCDRGRLARRAPAAAGRPRGRSGQAAGPVHRLADGARIADALRRAGGATRRADLSLVDLAAPVSDGSQVVVPKRCASGFRRVGGRWRTTCSGSGPVSASTRRLPSSSTSSPVLGPVTAQKIVDYREQHGAFSSVDDLDAIPGSGPRDSSSFASWWRREVPFFERFAPHALAAALCLGLAGSLALRTTGIWMLLARSCVRSPPSRSRTVAAASERLRWRWPSGFGGAGARLDALDRGARYASGRSDRRSSRSPGRPPNALPAARAGAGHALSGTRAAACVARSTARTRATTGRHHRERRRVAPAARTSDGFDERALLRRRGVHVVARRRSLAAGPDDEAE